MAEMEKVPGEVTGYLEAGLEGELQLRALDDDVGEVEQVHLKRVKHT